MRSLTALPFKDGSVRSTLSMLAERFPQLYLKPEAGVSQSELYRSIIRKGYRYEGCLSHFTGSAQDSITREQTPVGEVTVVFLAERADFECFYRIMACRCEPVEVPATMGASYISGINDWSKIHAHMDAYRENGGVFPEKSANTMNCPTLSAADCFRRRNIRSGMSCWLTAWG
jgi:hypothetical protein